MGSDTFLDANQWKTIGILVGGLATLGIFSFLYRENPFYRFFEHVFTGIGIGLGTMLTIKTFIWPMALKPVVWSGCRWAEEAGGDPLTLGNLYYLIPLAFGCLFYTIYSRKHNWLARLVIGFSLGSGGGLALKGFCATYLPQIIGSFKPLRVLTENHSINWGASCSNGIFVLTLLCVMTYFFFSFEHDKILIKQASMAGRWLMMICFGSFFGTTVMARIALLIERLQFLTTEWAQALSTIKGAIWHRIFSS